MDHSHPSVASASSSIPEELEHLPPVVLIEDVARIYRQHPETVRKKCRQGIFRPQPFDINPYRWRRVDIIDDLVRRPAEHVRRRRYRKAS